MHLQNFKCLLDVEVELAPFTILIGPNDSGKSSLLDAIHLLGRTAREPLNGHKGKKVYGKARHRDPVRSTKSYTAWRYGHKWAVLGVLVRFPFAPRPWALPVLVALYRSEEQNRQRQRPPAPPPS